MLPAVRLLTKSQAAQYCGLSVAKFGGVCPVRPIALGDGPRMHRYDVRDVDKWIDSFKAGGPAPKSVLEELLLDRLASPSSLDDRHIKILRYMRDHPECDTASDIRGAGERTLHVLSERNVVRAVGEDGKGRRRFVLTNLGKEELKKVEAWELDSRR